MKKIILASGSPRRRELLGNLGIDFEVLVSEADESVVDKEKVPAPMLVQELALLKATAVAAELKEKKDRLIIAADTIVVLDGEVMGKPKDEEDAKRMLSLLSGREHSVFTGICVMNPMTMFSVCNKEETKVKFKELSEDTIKAYIETGEPMDKAGAYGIQGIGALLTDGVCGDFFNVIGLPLSKLCEILKKEFEFDVFKERK